MFALSLPSLFVAALIGAVIMALLWRPLFSQEARGRRRRARNYRKVSSTRHHGPAVQLNLEVPKEDRERKGGHSR
ncbi:MAG: hypothetical protein ABS95_03705 [Verrucomicrobia bacterium SCN 57-15]|nr:MAG: hypothetical protein ABS95_03705 [Verrucomicrobia bacterium SCN 57-15]